MKTLMLDNPNEDFEVYAIIDGKKSIQTERKTSENVN